jgi:hypothetical protein
MSNFSRVAAGLLAASLLTPLAVRAHHSFSAEFDSSKVVHLVGTVVRFEWSNPHSWLYMDVKEPNGTVEHWKIEGGAPSLLLRRGWNRNSLPPGIKVVVNAYQARTGQFRASAREIVFPDGRTLDAASSYKQAEKQ